MKSYDFTFQGVVLKDISLDGIKYKYLFKIILLTFSGFIFSCTLNFSPVAKNKESKQADIS